MENAKKAGLVFVEVAAFQVIRGDTLVNVLRLAAKDKCAKSVAAQVRLFV